MNSFSTLLPAQGNLLIRQVHEPAEWLGFETRNHYQILSEVSGVLGHAAEQQKGFLGFLLRQFLGHWRSFEIHIFDSQRQRVLVARHPFRFYFERLEVLTAEGKYLGALQKKFSFLSKTFEVEGPDGSSRMKISSPIWSPWTFPFKRGSIEVGRVEKKWSGLFSEMLTDRDNFLVRFHSEILTPEDRAMLLAGSLFIDLCYFENKAGH